MKCPDSINNQFALLEELVKKIPDATPEMKTALRDALLEMSAAYKINTEGSIFMYYSNDFEIVLSINLLTV